MQKTRIWLELKLIEGAILTQSLRITLIASKIPLFQKHPDGRADNAMLQKRHSILHFWRDAIS
jgi:hypothetical protein